jgi:hypothetical protein
VLFLRLTLSSCLIDGDYHEEQQNPALHELNEAAPILINITHYEQGIVPFTQQHQQNRDVKLHDRLSLALQFIILPLELLG